MRSERSVKRTGTESLQEIQCLRNSLLAYNSVYKAISKPGPPYTKKKVIAVLSVKFSGDELKGSLKSK